MISDFIDRVDKVMKEYGYRNFSQLAKALGYSNSEKLSRLDRNRSNQPSFSIITDISNLLEGVNLNWLIAGEGEMLLADEQKRLGIRAGDTKMLSSSNANFKLDHENKTASLVNEPKTKYAGKKQTVQMDIYIKNNQIVDIKGVKVVDSKEFEL